jgi:signal transduction histidine kinase/DNA-binding response OmpR family regulator
MRWRTARGELLAGMMGVILVFLVASFLVADGALRNIAESEVAADVARARYAFQEVSALQTAMLVESARSLASAPYLKATVSIPDVDAETVMCIAAELQQLSQRELLLILDASGRILADTNDPASFGRDLNDRAVVRAATQGEVSADYWEYDGGVFEVSASPITEGDGVIGVLVLASRVDSRNAEKIRNAVGMDALIHRDGALVGESLRYESAGGVALPAAGDSLRSLQAGADGGELFFTTSLYGEQRTGTSLRLGSECTLVLSQSLDWKWAPYAVVERNAVQLGFVAALVGLLISMVISKNLARPIGDLSSAASRVAAGEFMLTVPERGNREVRELVASFNNMTCQLGGLMLDVERTTRLAIEVEAEGKVRSQFLASMSHELRTPMNGVLGMSGLLLETELDSDQRDFVETVQLSAESLLQIINDILDFAKVDAGKLELECIDFDLRTVIEETCDLMSQKFDEKGLDLCLQLQPELQTALRGDPGRIRQILLNYISNACKFTSSGEVLIEAALESETETHAKVRVAVKDSGIGIPEDKQHRLFQSFSQADSSTARQFGGTGLGLAIAKSLSALMGGEVGLHSVADEGSTFWFTAIMEKQPVRPSVAGPLPAQCSGLRALVADDNATSRRSVALQLAELGCEHELSEGGGEALEALLAAAGTEKRFGLLLLDAQMPGMDGPELARRVLGEPSLAGLQVVMLTSLYQRRLLRGMPDLGLTGLLTKPVKRGQLVASIAHVIGWTLTDASAADSSSGPGRSAASAAEQASLRILIVEDNLVNQKVVVAMLKKAGHEFEVAGNGVQALEALERGSFDMVLMDCQMPVMDGYEATRQIRRREGATGGHLPIIALTANAMLEDRERCLEAGMDDHLAKPVKPASLVKMIATWAPKGKAEADQGRDSELGPLQLEEPPSLIREPAPDVECCQPADGLPGADRR